MNKRLRTIFLLISALPPLAQAVQVCEVNGQSVSPYNGNTTAGKTGLMRCREGENGPLVREQELRNGVFMGVVRQFRDGVLQREHQVNERGNRDGLAREFAATAGASNQLLKEETLSNGTTVGLARSWHPNGKLKRASFHEGKGQEQAVAEFNAQGQLGDLRCAPQPLLGPDVDDAALCGHQGGKPATVALHSDNGTVRSRLTHERGERRKRETLWDSGQIRELQEVNADGGVERSFAANGVKRREVQWITRPDGARTQRITTLEQEFHESGAMVRERKWRVVERGGELQVEQSWYLNGQPREKQEYQDVEGQPGRLETRFHDNGKMAFQGLWLLKGRYETQAQGVHKYFGEAGQARYERHHDARGRMAREREFDESGRVVRDEELFEDGSRKSLAR